MDTIKAYDHYDRRKNREQKEYQFLSYDEIANLSGHAKVLSGCEVYDVKINGRIQTWKTRPGELSIPCKYGFRECFRVEVRDYETRGPVQFVKEV